MKKWKTELSQLLKWAQFQKKQGINTKGFQNGTPK